MTITSDIMHSISEQCNFSAS